MPYDKAHPGKPPRTEWSSWKTDQAFWCRGGAFYPQEICEHFIHYEGSSVEECLGAIIQRFQDGFVGCSIIETVGCKACWEHFMERKERESMT